MVSSMIQFPTASSLVSFPILIHTLRPTSHLLLLAGHGITLLGQNGLILGLQLGVDLGTPRGLVAMRDGGSGGVALVELLIDV